MKRREFVKVALSGLAVSVIPKTVGDVTDCQGISAGFYGYLRCPECGMAMLRVEEDGKMFVTCCGKKYKEPTIPLERVA